MSQHYHYPTREEFARRLINKPFPKRLTTLFAVLALIGLATFLGGVFTGQERAWHALHFNWLYFTVISTAGTAFAAVQRIVTGRWSRPIVRFAEGFVAFVPVFITRCFKCFAIGRFRFGLVIFFNCQNR